VIAKFWSRAVVVAFVSIAYGPASAQLPGVTDLLTAPKTLIDRAIEARSKRDIAKDNVIVVKVNAIIPGASRPLPKSTSSAC
jgi:hypothetical protein